MMTNKKPTTGKGVIKIFRDKNKFNRGSDSNSICKSNKLRLLKKFLKKIFNISLWTIGQLLKMLLMKKMKTNWFLFKTRNTLSTILNTIQ
jgi:hypothetical protein